MFGVSIAALTVPAPPAEVPNLAFVGIVVLRTLAVVGFGLTILVGWLFVPPTRTFKWVEVAVETIVLLISVELLGADPHALSWALCAVTAVALGVLAWRLSISHRPEGR